MSIIHKPSFNIAVVGGRDFINKEKAFEILDFLLQNKKENYNIKIISGGATGADYIAELYANKRCYDLVVYKADWNNLDAVPCHIKTNKYGKHYNTLAGMNRNKKIVNDSNAMVAFWDGTSRGTKNDIELALEKGIPVRVFDYSGKVIGNFNPVVHTYGKDNNE